MNCATAAGLVMCSSTLACGVYCDQGLFSSPVTAVSFTTSLVGSTPVVTPL